MQVSTRNRMLAAAAVAATMLLLPGCDLLGAPVPAKPTESVGVDPTGETLDNSTLPPDEQFAEQGEQSAARPSVHTTVTTSPAPRRRTLPAREPTYPASPPGIAKHRTPAGTGSGDDVRVGANGLVHHHLRHSGDGE